MKIKNILLACYGGGHAQSLIPVAKKLHELDSINLTVIGFTTARSMFEKAGVPVFGYDRLLTKDDQVWIDRVKQIKPQSEHPDIKDEETIAYYAIGIKELIVEFGEEKGLLLYRQRGRKSFLPEKTFINFLKNNPQDLVITSTSPRSELALIQAARSLSIPTLAVSDLFLQHESAYICDKNYAENITVISPYVEDFLRKKGFPEENAVFVTGNPAFDSLGNKRFKEAAIKIKKEICCSSDTKIITWICATGQKSLIGKDFIKTEKVVQFLEKFCGQHYGYKYLIRPHPSDPINIEIGEYGMLVDDIPVEVCLHLSDIFMMETSTIGLQAALMNKTVITINAGDYPPYAKLRLAVDVKDLESAEKFLLKEYEPDLANLEYPEIGTATDIVLGVIRKLL